MTKEISAKFSNLGFVAVCLVVTMHVHCGWEGGGINRLAVPFFFLMSGYFLAAHVEEDGWYARALSKRMRTLLLPLFAWCALWALYSVPIAIALNYHAGRPILSHVLTGWGVLRYVALDIAHTPALGPLWYVRCLFLFVLVSPLLVKMIRRLGVGALLLVCLAYVTYALYCHLCHARIDLLTYGFSLCGIFYFTVGLFLRMRECPLRVGLTYGVLLFSVGLAVYVMGCVEAAIPFMIVGLWGLVPARSFPQVLTKNTFPIYLIHMFVLLLFGSSKIANPAVAIGVGGAAILISIVAAVVLRKLFPKMAAFLFGGR